MTLKRREQPLNIGDKPAEPAGQAAKSTTDDVISSVDKNLKDEPAEATTEQIDAESEVYSVRPAFRHNLWLKARAAAEGRTVENMIDKCIRQAWAADQDRVQGASYVPGSPTDIANVPKV